MNSAVTRAIITGAGGAAGSSDTLKLFNKSPATERRTAPIHSVLQAPVACAAEQVTSP